MANDYFQKNLKYLLDHEISVNKILELTGLKSPSIVTMWKTGERQIMTKDLIAIANYLNYSIDDLINKDISINSNSSDELSFLFSKYRHILTSDDEEYIKFIINKRRNELKE